MRVDAAIIGFHRNFGAHTWIAGGFFDFQQAVFDFRHFQLKQFHQKFARGAGEQHLVAVADLLYAQKQRAHAVAVAEVFTRQHLVARQQGFEAADFDNRTMALHPLYRAQHQAVFALQKVAQNLLTLSIADALQNHLLGGLRADAAKFHVFNRLFVVFADLQFGVRNFFLDFFDGFLRIGVGVVFVGHNQPAAKAVVFAGVAINGYTYIHMLAVGLFLGRAGQGKLQGAKHHIVTDILFTGQRLGQQQNFTAHAILPNKCGGFGATFAASVNNSVKSIKYQIPA